MGLFLFLVVAGVIALLIFRSQSQESPRRMLALPYQKRTFFFTKAEQRFYQHLVKSVSMVSADLVIFSKVRMADLVIMTKGTTGRAYWSAWGRISQKHADFVILGPLKRPGEPDALQPLAIIELDDASHQRQDRQERDQLVDAIYGQAGLPILHIPVMTTYDIHGLARQLSSTLHLPDPTRPKPKVVIPVSQR